MPSGHSSGSPSRSPAPKFRMILWLKALHVIAVIAWMAGMLYLPRLFVYHADAPKGSDALGDLQGDGAAAPQGHRQSVDDPRVHHRDALAYLTGDWQAGWLQAKFILVLGLAGLHGYFARCVRAFAQDANERPARFYRVLNEVPTALMIVIVILAVVKPF